MSHLQEKWSKLKDQFNKHPIRLTVIVVLIMVFLLICYSYVLLICYSVPFRSQIEAYSWVSLPVSFLSLIIWVSVLTYFWEGKRWLSNAIYSSLNLVFGFLILAVVVLVIVHLWQFRSPYPSSSVIEGSESVVGGILNLVQLFLALIVLGGALAGLYVRKKLEDLVNWERNVTDLNRTVILGTEIALVNLPRFTETQHIPMRSMDVLQEIESLFFENPSMYNTLEKLGNGARIDLARGVYRFGKLDCTCPRFLKKVMEDRKADPQMVKTANLRLGIAYRQFDDFKNSTRMFRNLQSECDLDRYFNKLAGFGLGLTLYAQYRRKMTYGSNTWYI